MSRTPVTNTFHAAFAAIRQVMLSFIGRFLSAPRVEVVKRFALGGLEIEAVRVTYSGKEPFLVKDAIRAADTGGKVIRLEEHWQRIYADRANMPPDLNYWFVTARRDPYSPDRFSALYCDPEQGWGERWDDVGRVWYSNNHILRLCA